MLMLLIRLCAIFILSTFEKITFFWSPTLKKHQVVRDLKKFENHWITVLSCGRIVWKWIQNFASCID